MPTLREVTQKYKKEFGEDTIYHGKISTTSKKLPKIVDDVDAFLKQWEEEQKKKKKKE